ncbi:hypothetical protein DFH07DRAFT_785838 [Mycena maculata]|uniref:Uncharacterized protein n=1 Tax=Mycena maculata TaxID=230809 RepID=A0AAD7MEX6_9AGAR|nr:hypothetical protein DFH07DRAFT_785838 [Mycena maculata]
MAGPVSASTADAANSGRSQVVAIAATALRKPAHVETLPRNNWRHGELQRQDTAKKTEGPRGRPPLGAEVRYTCTISGPCITHRVFADVARNRRMIRTPALVHYVVGNREELTLQQRQVRKRAYINKHGIHLYIQRRFDAPTKAEIRAARAPSPAGADEFDDTTWDFYDGSSRVAPRICDYIDPFLKRW